ncbi:nucleotidyltransferase family protein [Sinimarinibacterium thermocellulolyticum]|uniref:Nucleotidyltransferase family protein n=1 Tax=Sinimarinibacterium thermocellulolyticum TaxID=3170016 RepID=A0ABV2A7Q8_9GAMM
MARSTEPRIAGVLLAAGAARRFGSPKQLACLDGVALVRRSAQALLDAGLPLTVVTGAHADAVGAALAGLPLRLIHNADWREGLGRSIACAVAALGDDAALDGVLIALADQPLVGASQLRRLLAAHEAGAITAADHGTVVGPPAVFARAHFAALAALRGDSGARALLAAQAGRLRRVPMPEAAIDIDTPAQWRAAQAAQRP